ncbi:MAG: nitroimidazol reductase NimA-like FMN-containing flavoprotein [Ilumatobacter sp.]|jgi:nitroimidazol reductase NimA-like FMN-containing flavoprotein (pyridoxamine 5'-phosphate oxidase superfamily)
MDTTSVRTETLSGKACWERLRQTAVGRLAIQVDGAPDIFPINFVVDGLTLVFRTKAGTKLAGATLLNAVAFEIDGYEPRRGSAWSVVVKGRARLVDGLTERHQTASLPLIPWVDPDKPEFVRIVPLVTTGRRFEIGEDVIADAPFGWDRTPS